MQIPIGHKAFDFSTKAIMPNNEIDSNFNLYNYVKNKKCILFFYPLDFTFVCPSEIISFNNRIGQFTDDRNTKVIGISVDSHYSHLAWKNTPVSKGGIGNIRFPLVSDLNKDIARNYGILNQDGVSYRATVFMDENLIIRHMSINDMPIGRNVDEILRIVDAWDHYKTHGEVCPAGWHKGDEAMQESAEGVADYLTSNAAKL